MWTSSLHGFRNFCALALVCTLLASGCITGVFGGPTVVERSKEQRPAWVELEAGRFHATETVLQYHDTKTKIPDLPIGIKVTQTRAIEGSERALQEMVRVRLTQVALQAKLGELAPSSELDSLVGGEVKRFHGPFAKVADIYYEKIQDETDRASSSSASEYYTAHVLVQFPTAKLQELYLSLSKSLQKARDPALRKLGQAVASPGASVSH